MTYGISTGVIRGVTARPKHAMRALFKGFSLLLMGLSRVFRIDRLPPPLSHAFAICRRFPRR